MYMVSLDVHVMTLFIIKILFLFVDLCFGCLDLCSQNVNVKDKNGLSYTLVVRKNLDFGGFSQIDLVSEKSSQNLFALKRIFCHSKNDEIQILNEAKFHLNLPKHPNLLYCLGTGVRKFSSHPQGAISEILLALEFSQKGTLQKELDARLLKGIQPFCIDLIRQIMTGICEGLLVLLSLDVPVSHRDIKPGNVLLFGDYKPVLMDFGSVTPAVLPIESFKDVERWKEFAEENCSLTYRAPEFFNPVVGQDISEKADVWSLGCLLFSLFYFKSPMDLIHARGDSVALAACSAYQNLPNDVQSKIPSDLLTLLKSMLSPNPHYRPTIKELLNKFSVFTPKVTQFEIIDAVSDNQSATLVI